MTSDDVTHVLLYALYAVAFVGPLLVGMGALFVGIGAHPVRRRDAERLAVVAAVLAAWTLVLPFPFAVLGTVMALAGTGLSWLRWALSERDARRQA